MAEIKPLWLSPSYPCEQDIYGAIWLQTQAHALQKIGITPRVIAPVPWVPPGLSLLSPKWKRYSEIPHRYDDSGINVFRPRYFSHPRENRVGAPHRMQFIRLLLSRLEKPSLIHAHFALPQGWVALQLAMRWEVPLVVSLLGDDVNVYPHVNAASIFRFNEVIMSADKLISQGSDLNDRTEEMTGIRSVTLPLGVKLERFKRTGNREQAREDLNLPKDAPIALFVGSLLGSKGIPELLRVLEKLSAHNLKCVFVGDGPLRSLVEETPGAIAVGSQDQSAVQKYLEAADIAVLPSHREGLPLSLVEAGAMELPVIATDVGSVRDLIGEKRGWLIPPKDEVALEQALVEVLSNPDEAASRAGNLYSHVQNNFSDQVNARRIAEIYKSLLS